MRATSISVHASLLLVTPLVLAPSLPRPLPGVPGRGSAVLRETRAVYRFESRYGRGLAAGKHTPAAQCADPGVCAGERPHRTTATGAAPASRASARPRRRRP